ncbi:MAG: hypothetical protein AAB213_01460 [Candidatus Omnitrophota bacterium]
MIKNKSILDKFERDYNIGKKDTFFQRSKIFESLWQEASHLKVLPHKNPLEDIAGCLRIARILNFDKSCHIKKYRKKL